MRKNRMPKDEYFFSRFESAFNEGHESKAAYYKARYEILTDSYIAAGLTEKPFKYHNYSALDKHPNYIETRQKYS